MEQTTSFLPIQFELFNCVTCIAFFKSDIQLGFEIQVTHNWFLLFFAHTYCVRKCILIVSRCPVFAKTKSQEGKKEFCFFLFIFFILRLMFMLSRIFQIYNYKLGGAE